MNSALNNSNSEPLSVALAALQSSSLDEQELVQIASSLSSEDQLQVIFEHMRLVHERVPDSATSFRLHVTPKSCRNKQPINYKSKNAGKHSASREQSNR